MNRIVGLSVVLVFAVAGISCGDDESIEPTPTSTVADAAVETPTTPDASPGTGPIEVTSDLRFAEEAPDLVLWSEPLVDVYVPRGGPADLPLVVMLPPHSLEKHNPATVQLANHVADRGAVVAVVNWSELENPPEHFQDPEAVREIARAGQSVANCAVSFVASNAGEFGADPSRLVLVGELFGANTASMVVLGTADPLRGCRTPGPARRATGLVGLNADWLVSAPFFDAVASAAVEVFSPWALLDEAPVVPTRLAVTSAATRVGRRCDDRDADWMVLRDPTGAVRAGIDAVGGLDDGCLDLGDEAAVMAREMSEHGLPAEVVWLTDADGATRSGSGGQVLEFGGADVSLLADTIIGATGPLDG